MKIPGYDQPPPEAEMQGEGDPGAEDQSQGDGLHHHEIHEDEGGGFHSLHTFPDGRTDPGDHVDYDEAKSKMDSDFGCGPDDEDDEGGMDDGGGEDDSSFGGDGEDSGITNLAKSYGSKARK